MVRKCPRLVIAGLSGDSGKTITSLSLLTALRRSRRAVSVFKKGPDYIDAAWLSWASGTDCRNLDTYMIEAGDIPASFCAGLTDRTELAVIEGNRGLFDGMDSRGTHSTAGLARLLRAPVVVVVDCTKATRTVAALIKGCQVFDPDLNLAGVILNRVAGERHRRVITDAIEQTCGIPVLGAIPRLQDTSLIPGRHLGLVTPAEFGENPELEQQLVSLAERYLDLDRLLEVARAAEPLTVGETVRPVQPESRARVGYFRDSVFTFYYPENLEALEAAGAKLVPVSSLDDASLPEIDALYIGGGFPETHAERLSANRSMLASVAGAARNGLPIYAECGGLIFLCRSLKYRGKSYPLAGLFPVDLEMQTKPVGHGYTEAAVDRANPFYAIGTVLKGHEFHYSGPVDTMADDQGCFRIGRGVGLGNGRDGLRYKNCLACYTHLHAVGTPDWATGLVARAAEYRAASGRTTEDGAEAVPCVSEKPKGITEMMSRPGLRANPQVSGW